MTFPVRASWGSLVLAGLLTLLGAAPAFAHEHRDIGVYEFVVGWASEPAFEGQKNGIDLRVSRREGMTPVEGLDQAVKVEITHVPTNTMKTLDLRAVFNAPGRYTADLLLTAPGDYRFRFFGTIEGVAVNETFQSSDGKFDSIGPSADIQFPIPLASGREMQSAVQGAVGSASQAQVTAMEAQDKASSATTVGIAALVVALVGAILGGGALVAVMRRR